VAPLFAFESYQLDRIAESSRFQTCALSEVVPDPLGQQVVTEFAAEYPLATILYPLGSLQSLSALQGNVRPGGLFLISDKGFADPARMEGIHEEVATTHGNSLAHPVNFPLLARWAALQGWGQACTEDPTNALHTLLLTPHGPIAEGLAAAFAEQFLSNANMDSHFWLEAGYLFLKQGELEQAGHYFTRALRLRPMDAPLLYLAAVALLNRGRHSEALTLLRRPHDDAFGVLNFAILEAEACRTLGLHSEAVEAYHRALAGYGESSVVYYNLALSLEALGEPEAARSALERGAELDPEDVDIQLALREFLEDA
jgi:tetratricopeptide (TPR) repeat protein